MEDSATTLNTANARIAFHFHARDLILAMGQQHGHLADRSFEITFLAPSSRPTPSPFG